jgi:hypothetical protein
MKKTIPSFALLSLAAVMGLFSCKKEAAESPASASTPATTMSVEQNKSNMQSSGVSLVKNLNSVKTSVALDAMHNFSKLSVKASPFANNKMADDLGPIRALFALAAFKETGDPNVLYASMKTATASSPTSPQDAFNQNKGIYTYDATTSTWTKAVGDNIVLTFPATAASTTNNAVYTVTYKSYTGPTLFTNYTGDLPASIAGALTIDGNPVAGISLNVTYAADGTPANTAFGIDLDPYHFLLSLTTTTPLVGYNFSIKNNTTTLIDYGISALGNFSKQNIQSLNDSSFAKMEDVTKLATSFNAHWQVMDIRAEGTVDLQGMANGFTAVGGSDKATKAQVISNLNKNYHLGLIYASTRATIANTEFYMVTTTNTYNNWVYNQTTMQYEMVPVTTTSDNMEMRFVFPDGSRSDFNTYFKSGFDQVHTEWNGFTTDVQSKFN